MTLCEKLTQARKAAGLTQADIAARLSVSRQAVSRWESGQSKPSTEKLLALGGALRRVHRPAFECRKFGRAHCGGNSRPARSGTNQTSHSRKTLSTSKAEIRGCCALRCAADAGASADSEKA